MSNPKPARPAKAWGLFTPGGVFMTAYHFRSEYLTLTDAEWMASKFLSDSTACAGKDWPWWAGCGYYIERVEVRPVAARKRGKRGK